MPLLILVPLLSIAPASFGLGCDENASSLLTTRAAISTAASTSGNEGGAEQSVAVQVANGKVSVTLNGSPVPDNRLRRDGSRLVILDDRGRPIDNMPFIQVETDGSGQDSRVTVRSSATGGRSGASAGGGASSGASAGSTSGAGSSANPSVAAVHEALMEAARSGNQAVAQGQRAWAVAQDAAREEARKAGELMKQYFKQFHRGNEGGDGPAQVTVAQPKVMLGVNLDDAGDALLRQLRLEPGTVTVVTSVIEGLPASKAGVEPFDVVIEVDGRRPAGPPHVREVIATKKAGDPLRLLVVRGGEKKQLELKLEAYDAAKLGNEVAVVVEADEAAQDPQAMHDAIHRSLEGLNIQIEPYLHQLRDTLRFAPLPRDPNAPPGAGPGGFIYELRPTPGGAAPDPAADTNASERLDRLEKRLDDMSRRLERLLEKLEKLDA